jgi:hypothetical protein
MQMLRFFLLEIFRRGQTETARDAAGIGQFKLPKIHRLLAPHCQSHMTGARVLDPVILQLTHTGH